MLNLNIGTWRRGINVHGKEYHGYFIPASTYPIGYVLKEADYNYKGKMLIGEQSTAWFKEVSPAKSFVVNEYVTWRLNGNKFRKE